MADSYISRTPQGGYRIGDTRVSLDSVVHAWWEGRSPEAIAADFPALSLELVHGAIAFYLGHRTEIDRHLSEQDVRWHVFQRESAERMAPLVRKLRGGKGVGMSVTTGIVPGYNVHRARPNPIIGSKLQ